MHREIKKILSKKYVRLTVILLCGFAILLGWIGGVTQATYYEDNNVVSRGRKAAINNIELYGSVGELSDKRVSEILLDYQMLVKKEGKAKALQEIGEANQAVLMYLSEIYFPEDFFNQEGLANIEDTKHFSEARVEAILNKFRREYGNSEGTEAAIQKYAVATQKSVQFAWRSPWVTYFRIVSVLAILTALAAIIIGTDTFTYEKTQKMDLLLTGLDCRGTVHLLIQQMMGVVTFLTALWGGIVLLFTIAFWQLVPLPASGSSIQLIYPLSIYSGTVKSGWVIFLFLSWFCILTTGLIAVAINHCIQNGIGSLGITFAVTILPLAMEFVRGIPLGVRSLVEIQPLAMLWAEKLFSSFVLYRIGNHCCNSVEMGLMWNVVLLMILFLVLMGRIFRRTLKRGY
ncbi:hypothetical protein [Shuttleworthella satelles]|uniref:hypothetical protein n=1 Tax=Shuttleworthella satelles TaxID=177972 RepID=UPI0028D8B731|nr:hypothetical protein [Shuttleworthia satelles]